MNALLKAMNCAGNRGEQINKEQKKASKRIEKSLEEDKRKYNSTHRLLILGKTNIISFGRVIFLFSYLSFCFQFNFNFIL